jgi:MarR family 2-MHQ and catechol resistance regulon transcriptional repressor
MPSNYAGSPLEVEALSAFINLMRASDSVAAALQRDHDEQKMSASQFGILEALFHLGPLCQGELSKKMLRCTGSITSVVAGLEKKGMLLRAREDQDKRFVRVTLTTKGKKAIEQLFPAHVRAVVQRFGALTPEEQKELRRLCAKLGKAAMKD